MLESKIIVLRRYGLGIFFVGFLCVSVAFVTPAWIVSRSDFIFPFTTSFGLFYHCHTTSWHPEEKRQTSISTCRVHFAPFRQGFGTEFVQYFFSFCFFGCFAAFVLIVMLLRYGSHWQKPIVKLRRLTVSMLFTSGICGILASVVFPWTDSTSSLMKIYNPHEIPEYSSLGYSFIFAIVGAILLHIASSMLFAEIYMRNKNKQSQPVNETQPQVRLIADT